MYLLYKDKMLWRTATHLPAQVQMLLQYSVMSKDQIRVLLLPDFDVNGMQFETE